MKSIFVILLAVSILFGCKIEEKCGCDSEPYKTVSNVEAFLLFGYILHLKEHGDELGFCNIEMAPEEIIFMSKEAGLEGIDVIVSGDLHKGCKQGRLPPTEGFTLIDIKLPEK